MTREEKINIMKNVMSKNNGYIVLEHIIQDGYDKSYIEAMIEEGYIEKEEDGIYLDKNVLPDSYYLLQLLNPFIIYSHITSLYFHQISNCINYDRYSLSLPEQVDTNYLKKHYLYKCNKINYELGLSTVKTTYGNIVKAYDIERSICDIIIDHSNLDIDEYADCLKNYIKSKNKNLRKLCEYGKKLNISNDILDMILVLNEII